MEFLEYEWMDNSLRSYLSVASVILVLLLLKRFVARPFAILLFHIIRKCWRSIDKASFLELVMKPIGVFIIIVASITAISVLQFPKALDVDIYGTAFQLIFERLLLSSIIISFIWLSGKIIDFTSLTLEKKAKLTEDKRDDQLIVFTKNLLKIILGILGILLVIRVGLNRNISSLLTGLSIIGAALALAAKETIENLIASFIIFFDKPFTAGDIIRVNNINGTIEYIGLRSTRIRTNDKTLVTVPNKQMVDSIVDNWTVRTERRGEIKIEVHIQTSVSKLENLAGILSKWISEQSEVKNSSVLFSEFSKQAKVLSVEYFTAPFNADDFNAIKEKINFGIATILEENNIEMATGNNINIITEGGLGEPKSKDII
jgi:MscS family membrane protein